MAVDKKFQIALLKIKELTVCFQRCLTTGHALDWDRASGIGKGTAKHKVDFIEAWNTTSTCVNQYVTLDPDYRALRDNSRR